MSLEQNVFLIDDDASVRAGLSRLLRTAGYNVLTYGSAREFLDALESKVSGCIVIDSRIFGITSEELLRALGERSQDLPIIFVTAVDTPALRKTAEKIKAVGFFRKPIDGMALLDAIKWALKSKTPSK